MNFYRNEGAVDFPTSSGPLQYHISSEEVQDYKNALVSREISTVEGIMKFLQRHLNYSIYRMEVEVSNVDMNDTYFRIYCKETDELCLQIKFDVETSIRVVMPLQFARLIVVGEN